MTLTGYDLSSNNTPAHLATALASDFGIVKASQSVDYVNPVHDLWVGQVRAAGKLVGHYHYAYPSGNGPEPEARAFLAAAKPQPGDVLALDFEPSAIMPVYPMWVLTFAAAVYAEPGAQCWLYTNDSQGKALMSLSTPAQRAALARMPLWKAYYQPDPGDLMGWPGVTCWQRTNKPLDTNVFYGDAQAWRALGVQEDDMPYTEAQLSSIVHDAVLGVTRSEEFKAELATAAKAAVSVELAAAVADELAKRLTA